MRHSEEENEEAEAEAEEEEEKRDGKFPAKQNFLHGREGNLDFCSAESRETRGETSSYLRDAQTRK